MNKKHKDVTHPPFYNKTVSKEVIRGAHPRSGLERWLDRHNHKMEFLRTLFGLLTIGLQVVILLKIFNFI
jgi:hypothetical protein